MQDKGVRNVLHFDDAQRSAGRGTRNEKTPAAESAKNVENFPARVCGGSKAEPPVR